MVCGWCVDGRSVCGWCVDDGEKDKGQLLQGKKLPHVNTHKCLKGSVVCRTLPQICHVGRDTGKKHCLKKWWLLRRLTRVLKQNEQIDFGFENLMESCVTS